VTSAILLAGIVASLAASPGEFHSISDISCPDGAMGCRVELPAWVGEVQPAVGDGRSWAVYTERGEALPWRDASDSVAPAETTWTDLPSLGLEMPREGAPVERLTLAAAEGRFALDWSRSTDSSAVAPATRWILDLRTFRGSVVEILPLPGNFLGSLTLEGGDDLVRWNPRGSVAVARIDSGAFSVRRLRFPLEERRDMFLRLVWTPVEGSLALAGIRGGIATATPAAPARRDDLGIARRSDSGWAFDAKGRPPVVGVFVDFRRRGAFGEFVVETRSAKDQPWTPATIAYGWHRGTNGLAFQNDTAWFSTPIRARYWRVRATGSAATMGDSVRLLLRSRPDRIEFPTGGAARLVFAAGLEPVAFHRLPQVSGATPKDPARGMVGSPRRALGEAALVAMPDRRAWILGGTLFFAVLALLGLAWRLWRDTRKIPLA
jgi:hypothetical protein